jgi:hypothetical protein
MGARLRFPIGALSARLEALGVEQRKVPRWPNAGILWEGSQHVNPSSAVECKCDHDPAYLEQEIAARRWGHEYRERRDTREVILVCLRCDGLWDHGATDRIIERIMRPRRPDTGKPTSQTKGRPQAAAEAAE